MKIKSFTLVEILIASTIFTVVILTVVSTFALIRSSNYKSTDSKVAASCARQIEDYIKAEVTSSNTSPRIELIEQGQTDPNSYSISSVPSFDPDNYPVLGLALFQGNRVKLVFKNPYPSAPVGGRTYRYKNITLAIYTSDIKPGGNINDLLVADSFPLFSDECRTKDGNESFRLTFREKYPLQTATPNTDASNDIYEVKVEDSVFRFIAGGAGNLNDQWARAEGQGTVSRINLDVTNSASKL